MTHISRRKAILGMQMDTHPGHLIFGSMGRKYQSIDQLPDVALDAAERYLPNHLNDLIKREDYLV